MNITKAFVIFFGMLIQPAFGQNQLSAYEILKKCIDYHDPKGKFLSSDYEFQIQIKRNAVADRLFNIKTSLNKGYFEYKVENEDRSSLQGFDKGVFFRSLNGSKFISEEQEKKYDLSLQRTQYLKDVYEYLLYLPFKLKFDTDFLEKEVKKIEFNKRNCFRLIFVYDPNGKKEKWYFFIDSSNFELVGYQFFKVSEYEDGEYIFLSDYQEINGCKLPFRKDWYWNKDKSFFRTDQILEAKKIKIK